MYNVGDHVYHTGVEANGVIKEVDETKRDPYRLVFHWAKYCDVKHGAYRGMRRPDRKWMWCRDDMLKPLDLLANINYNLGQNKVSMLGNRSLDQLIRHMTGMPLWRPHYNSDVVINYGTVTHMNAIPNIKVINRVLTCNKFIQMQMMGEELCPQSTKGVPWEEKGWIVKPQFSIGGKGIYRWDGRDINHGDYFQKEFNKVREFRAHCFTWLDNKVPFIQEKVCNEPNQLTWNKKQGGKFRYVYQEGLEHGKFVGLEEDLRARITQMSVEALGLLHYDMGGLDFGMDAAGKLKIFEVNSRMGLRERSFFTYIKAFDALKGIRIGG